MDVSKYTDEQLRLRFSVLKDPVETALATQGECERANATWKVRDQIDEYLAVKDEISKRGLTDAASKESGEGAEVSHGQKGRGNDDLRRHGKGGAKGR